jgi:hypothetical protein
LEKTTAGQQFKRILRQQLFDERRFDTERKRRSRDAR